MKRGGATCGGARGPRRLRQGARFRRREEKALPSKPAKLPALWPDVEWALTILRGLPGPWEPDIDDPVYDPSGRLVDGEWTGKVFTGRRGSFCVYLDEGPGYRTAAVILALCILVTRLPELVRLARLGAEAERR